MSPVINKDLRLLRDLKTFHLRQKPQSNHSFKRNVKASDINILLQVNRPDLFEFILDYVDCTFKFKDLRHIIEVNSFRVLRAYVNTLKYQQELSDDIVALNEWNKRSGSGSGFEQVYEQKNSD